MSRRAAPSIECPLASLGRNTPSLDTNLYHHPLSSSPLDPQIYKMSRKSPILEITQNDRIIVSAASNLHHQIPHQRTTQISSSSGHHQNHRQHVKTNPNIYHLSQSSSSSVEQTLYGLRRDPKPNQSASHQQMAEALISYHHERTNPKGYLLDDRLGGGGSGGVSGGGGGGGCADDQCSSSKSSQNGKYYLDDKIETFYNIDNSKLNHNTERYYLEDNLNMCHYQGMQGNENKFIQKSMVRGTSSPSETSESDRYLIEPMNHLKLASNRMFEKSPFQATRYNSNSPQCFINGLSRICRYSPTFDQGYHTLVSPSPTGQQTPGPWINNNKRNTNNYRSGDAFDRLPDEMVLKIFNWLDNCELCKIARVCRRFETLIWKPILWKVIRLKNNMDGDKALKIIFKRLCRQKRNANCLGVEHILLSDGCKITDKGLDLVSRKCPELTHLQIQFSATVTNASLNNVLTQCTNLQHLDITGCTQITHLDTHPSLDDQITNRRLLLQYLDLTDGTAVTDNGLKVIVKNCPQLVFVYLRRCIQITDVGLKHLPSFCVALRELSVSDCSNITDFGLYELAKLGATLRYLSVAKCDKISDAGLKVIARRCYKLRYLNARGCEAVSDDSITVLAKSCPRLRALDIGKCDVSDTGLRALAESCPNLKKLGLRNCDMITDIGVQCIAYYCRGLQQLNIQDCQITIEGYRAVKKYCKRCVIEHTNPGFC